jgi:hypothetical protein
LDSNLCANQFYCRPARCYAAPFSFNDVAKLLEVLHELVDTGNTVAVIEHNLEVIKTADWIIDLGPEAWPGLDPAASGGGGEIVVAGPPEDIVREKRSSCFTALRVQKFACEYLIAMAEDAEFAVDAQTTTWM